MFPLRILSLSFLLIFDLIIPLFMRGEVSSICVQGHIIQQHIIVSIVKQKQHK